MTCTLRGSSSSHFHVNWWNLSRLSTGHGRCNEMLLKRKTFQLTRCSLVRSHVAERVLYQKSLFDFERDVTAYQRQIRTSEVCLDFLVPLSNHICIDLGKTLLRYLRSVQCQYILPFKEKKCSCQQSICNVRSHDSLYIKYKT